MRIFADLQKYRMVVALAAGLAGFSGLTASAQQVPRSQAQVKLSFAPVVKQAAPAVVNIFTRRIVRQRRRSPMFDDPFFRRFFGEGPSSSAPRRMQNSLGSGVIVSANGFVVTNNHVIKGADEIRVVLSDGREFDAKAVLKDVKTDLAVLRIRAKQRLPFLRFLDSDRLEVGDLVLAIGNPFGVGQTVTSGIVSALARSQVGISDYQFFIQTDAAINPGNSGGALIDVDGRLVGINTAIFSRSGGSNGIGFAIPANMVRVVVQSARQGGAGVRRPWLGAEIQKLTPEIAEAMGLKRRRGALVKGVYPKSPAARAGLKRGDVIHSVGDTPVNHPQELNYRLATRELGTTVDIGVVRNRKRITARLQLQTPPEDPPRNTRLLKGRHPFDGAEVANLSPALADELKLALNRRGVVVMTAKKGIARKLRFRRGDVIVRVEGEEVRSVRHLQRILRRGPLPDWTFTVQRGKRLFRTTVAG